MAPIAVTHPHEIWNLGGKLGALLEKLGLPSSIADFFDLMPQVDLDEIRRVGNDIWGVDLEKPGAISDTLDQVAEDMSRVVGNLEYGWKDSKAFDNFEKHAEIDQKHLKQAAAIAQNVGQALVGFADAADTQLTDKLGALVGITGAFVGAALGFIGGGGAAAIPGAILGLAVGIAFAYFGVMIPKVAGALQKIQDLKGQMPPGHDG